MKSYINDVLIIGAGPAGITAAIYLKRAGLLPIILEKSTPGGTLNKTSKIENYPGFTETEGTMLAYKMYSQVMELGIELKIEETIKIEKEDNYYKVTTNKGEYKSKYIILATGKQPRKLYVEDAIKYENKGISYCAICDGALYKGKDVIIVGGGNSALSAALYLEKIANKIYIINRSNKLRADSKEQNEIKKHDNIEVLLNTKIQSLLSKDEHISGVILDNGKKLNVDGIFVYIGQENTSRYYEPLDLISDNSGIIVNNYMETSDNNVYACGDLISKELYQIVTATSEGAVAANSIIKKLG